MQKGACVKGWWCNLQIGGALSGDAQVRCDTHYAQAYE